MSSPHRSAAVINLVTHSEVAINAQPAQVWPYILEPNTWKQGLKPVFVAGTRDAVGEVRAARLERQGRAFALTAETVVLVPNVRKVIKLTLGDNPPGWATWQLTYDATVAVTRVSYSVYSQLRIHDAPQQTIAGNQARFDAELVALRDIIEQT